MTNWQIKGNKFKFHTKTSSDFSSPALVPPGAKRAKRTGKKDAAQRKPAPSVQMAEQKLQPKRSGKSFGKPC